MCPPGCYHAICDQATRRGLLKAGFGLGVACGTGAVGPSRRAGGGSPGPSPSPTRSI